MMIVNEQSFIPRNIDIGFKKQAWFTSIAYTTFLLFGIARGYPAFLELQLQSPESAVYLKTKEETSWITCLSIFPNPIGSVLAGAIIDRFGRKLSLQLSLFVFTVGWGLIACSNNVWVLSTGNVIVGLAIGIGACSTIYVAEICEVKNRCMMLSFLEIYFSLGILIAYVLTCYLKWQLAALIFTIASAISFILLFNIPESPYWLMKDNMKTEALKAYNKIRGRKEDHPYDEEFNNIASSLESVEQPGWNVLFRNFKPFLILIFFHLLLQGCGYTIILTSVSDFTPEVSKLVKDSIAIGYSVCSFLSSFITPFTANYYRRREATMISGIGMTISLSILMFHNYYSSYTSSAYFWVLVPIGLYSFVFCCTIGILTLSQAMISELFPTEVRGKMCGITEAVGTILSGLSVKLFPLATAYMDLTAILAIFTAFALITTLFGKFVLPETYGKSLIEIQQQYFQKNEKDKADQIERKV